MVFRVSLDSGGTFVDGVALDDAGRTRMAKAHATPHDPSIGTIECLRRLASLGAMTLEAFLAQTRTIVHGTTLATNLVATRSGAKVGTITTRGFRDRLTFQQVAKADWRECAADMFDFRLDAPQPLTRRHLMTEVTERVDARGRVLTPLDEGDVLEAIDRLKTENVESIAIILLFSHLYPAHERRIAEIVEAEYPDAHVTISSSVAPIRGEVERWSTALFSAYVAPAVRSYVARIERSLSAGGFLGDLLFMQSNGGVAAPSVVRDNPATLLISGPSAGPSLGLALGKRHGFENVLSIDMGGTSFDVGVVHEGAVNVVQEQIIDAKKFALPSVDVTAVGAGGGSIAWVDASGRLQVGPKSAGAEPGPACYGRGGVEPTVTDADVVLGYIDPDRFLGGETRLRRDLAETAIRKVADPLGLSVAEAAAAIYEVVNAKMASATEVTFAKRGYDPRDFLIVAGGGAALVHAVKIMEDLGVERLLAPKMAPTYCAFGMLFSDLRHDFCRSYNRRTAVADVDALKRLFDDMEAEATDTLVREGVGRDAIVIERSIDMRYAGQFRELTAPLAAGSVTHDLLRDAASRFGAAHHASVGYSDPSHPTEIVQLRVSGFARLQKPRLEATPEREGRSSTATPAGFRAAWFRERDGFVETAVFDGDRLPIGAAMDGPCIIEEALTTIVIPPGAKVVLEATGYMIERKADDAVRAESAHRPAAAEGIDPTTLSVVWNRLEYVANQIGEKVIRATQSFAVAKSRDFGQVILDSRGRILTPATCLPTFTLSAEATAKGLRATFGEDYQPGDFIVANDAYIVSAAHLPDWNFVRPAFYKDELIGFIQCSTHVTDTGGSLPGGYAPGAYDIIAEGLNIPPVKVIKAGVLQKDLWDLILRNVRTPREIHMDTMLINGVLAWAEMQLAALADKYGLPTVKACMETILGSGEKAMRAEIAKMPDGVYFGESAADWDGATDAPIWVRVKVTIKGDEITFDFSGTDAQVTFNNCPVGVTKAYAAVALFFVVSPDVPKNSGSNAPVTVIAPEGSVVNPAYPATVGGGHASIGNEVVNACLLALGQAVPERAMAPWAKHCSPLNVGIDPRLADPATGRTSQYMSTHFASCAGSGGVKGFDGWQGISCITAAGNLVRPNVEDYESDVPYRVLAYEVLPDWEGAGEFRGSPGTYTVTLAETPDGVPAFLQTGSCGGMRFAPPGVAGGGEAPPVEMYIEDGEGERRILRTMANQPVYPGERIVTQVSGGGGWGDPRKRAMEKVRGDVVDGYVSIERAREVYGVVIDPATFEIDDQGTRKLRSGTRVAQKV